MPVQRMQAAIARVCPAAEKDRLVGLLPLPDALWFGQRRAEAGQLQQRRVNFSGRKRFIESPDSLSNRDILDHHRRVPARPPAYPADRNLYPECEWLLRFGIAGDPYRS